MSNAHHALSQITPTEAHALLSFMQGHIPEPRKLDPAMTREQNQHVELLMDKIRLVLSFRAAARSHMAAAADLYDVEYGRLNGFDYDIVKDTTGLFANQLQENFRQVTGLDMSL